jgi:uncharacterized protein YraI
MSDKLKNLQKLNLLVDSIKMKLFIFLCVVYCLADITNNVPPAGTKLECTGSDLNARAGPCTNQGVVGKLQFGAEVKSLGEAKNGCGCTWWKVQASFGTCWVASDFLRIPGQNPNLCYPVKRNSFLSESGNHMLFK